MALLSLKLSQCSSLSSKYRLLRMIRSQRMNTSVFFRYSYSWLDLSWRKLEQRRFMECERTLRNFRQLFRAIFSSNLLLQVLHRSLYLASALSMPEKCLDFKNSSFSFELAPLMCRKSLISAIFSQAKERRLFLRSIILGSLVFTQSLSLLSIFSMQRRQLICACTCERMLLWFCQAKDMLFPFLTSSSSRGSEASMLLTIFFSDQKHLSATLCDIGLYPMS